ncbi:HAD-IIB family hydrolase [Streptococcaceae bacterium ESL0687]|nr:HAD-IIB family hydrolase [Streptococcaceae bacterium ESL0687]
MIHVFDLDGTLVFNGVSFRDDIKDALNRLIDKGQEVIFASARPIRDMLPLLEDFSSAHFIGGNGSIIKDKKGNIEVLAAINEEAAQRIEEIISKYQVSYLIDGSFDYAASIPDSHPIKKQVDPGNLAQKVERKKISPAIKILLLDLKDDIYEAVYRELTDNFEGELEIYRHRAEGGIDISAVGVNKYSSLKRYLPEGAAYTAWGNDANDIKLINNASKAYLVNPAEEVIKECQHHENLTIISGQDYVAESILEYCK